jgi:hypothetical protein
VNLVGCAVKGILVEDETIDWNEKLIENIADIKIREFLTRKHNLFRLTQLFVGLIHTMYSA